MPNTIDAAYIRGPEVYNGHLPDNWPDKVQLALNRMADRTGGANGGGDHITTLDEANTIIKEYDVGGNAANPATPKNGHLEPIEQILAIQSLGIYSISLPGPYPYKVDQTTLDLAAYGRKLYGDAIKALPGISGPNSVVQN